MDCISEGSDKLLQTRVEDTVHLCDKRSAPCFLGFLDLHEQAVVKQLLSGMPGVCWSLSGGFEQAERQILSVFPDYYTADDIEYPYTAVGFTYRTVRKMTHRDILGTLMSLGVRRDKIGDILCGEGLSVVFLRSEIATFVYEQVDRIGGEGVTVVPHYSGELPYHREYQDICETIASPRLDVIVKTLCRWPREKAAEAIRSGLVSVDHMVNDSISATIAAPCTVSIRGSGRYLIDRIGPETRKGRLLFEARKCL